MLESGEYILEKNGLIIIDKDPGITSFSVVSRLRKIIGMKRIGHCGTLDPFATGVLPVAFGRGTAAIQFMEDYRKSYEVLAVLGQERDTQDREGSITRQVSHKDVKRMWQTGELARRIGLASKEMTGHINQVPPMFSALKHEGKALYEYARKGKEIERKARPVHVLLEEIALLCRADLPVFLEQKNFTPAWPIPDEAEIFLYARLDVSKGTYIRSWIEDLGRKIGSLAYCENLKRIKCGPFVLQTNTPNSKKLLAQYDELGKDRERMYSYLQEQKMLYTIGDAFADRKRIQVSADKAKDLVRGKPIFLEEGDFSQYDPDEELLIYHKETCLAMAFLQKTDNRRYQIKTKRVFISHENL